MPQTYALVTGASSGIGEVFARELARSGRSLILVARSTQRLELLRSELQAAYPALEVVVLPRDLSQPDAAAEVFRESEDRGLDVDLLINNAGFGAFDDFVELPLHRQKEMLRLNIEALVDLTHYFLRPMRMRRAGAVVNIASTAAFFPGPYFATYAASKAFVLSFSQALFVENRSYGVLVMAVCPGATATNFFEVAKMHTFAQRIRMQTPEQVVREALHALRRRRPVVVTGVANKVLAISSRFIPRVILFRFIGPIFERMYQQQKRTQG
jgi:hypothetical protein